jgi:Trk K+ transport system NAD-binding subunit
VAVLAGGVVVLGALALSRPVDRVLTRVIRRALARWTDLDVRDYAGLLELGEGYAVAELEVEETDWLAGRELGELTLRDAGIVVLGIHRRDAAYVGAPEETTTVCPGDVLTVYGLEERVEALDAGRAA